MGKDIKDFVLPRLDESGMLFTLHIILIKMLKVFGSIGIDICKKH
jgi:hypothetical protein